MQVYKGEWQGVDVAMKSVTQLSKLQELKEEAAIFQKLNHQNIVQFFGLYEVVKIVFHF